MFCRFFARIKIKTIKRNLLTQSYQCNTLWKDRLKDIDCKLSANELNIQFQASLNNDKPISALDFDILMNKVNEVDVINLEYIQTLIKSFRKTQESINAFPSSSHALIKNLIEIDEPYCAYDLLKDRQNTGIFLDEISTNLLIEKFITEKDLSKAFLTSAEWILQEEFQSSKLCLSMSLYSCLQSWNDKLWQYKPPVAPVTKKQDEYVRVTYLKPNSFDDHFDLIKDDYRRRLLGKCLWMIADNWNPDSSSDVQYVVMNVKLLGLALHEKLEALLDHLNQMLQNDDVKINRTLMSQVQELIETAERTNSAKPVAHPTYSDDDVTQFVTKYQESIQKFNDKGSIEDGNFLEIALKFVNDKIREHCEEESDLVRQKYERFNDNRVAAFEKTKKIILQKAILDESKKKLLEVMEKEEEIKYFEMLPEIMYKAWLAKRTKEELKFSPEKDEQENLDNIKKQEKKKFVVQHVPE